MFSNPEVEVKNCRQLKVLNKLWFQIIKYEESKDSALMEYSWSAR